jgi:uroporphyrinogen-III synthase
MRTSYIVVNYSRKTKENEVEFLQQHIIVDFVLVNFPKTRIIKCNGFIQNELNIVNDDDIVFWTASNAARNITNLKEKGLNIVVLMSPTNIYNGLSVINPFDENAAIQHDVYIVYAQGSMITNELHERKYVIPSEKYILTVKGIQEMIRQ